MYTDNILKDTKQNVVINRIERRLCFWMSDVLCISNLFYAPSCPLFCFFLWSVSFHILCPYMWYFCMSYVPACLNVCACLMLLHASNSKSVCPWVSCVHTCLLSMPVLSPRTSHFPACFMSLSFFSIHVWCPCMSYVPARLVPTRVSEESKLPQSGGTQPIDPFFIWMYSCPVQGD